MTVTYIGEQNKNPSAKQQSKLQLIEITMRKLQTAEDTTKNESITVGYASNGFIYVFADDRKTFVTIDENGVVSPVTRGTVLTFNYLFEPKPDATTVDVNTFNFLSVEYPTTITFTENNGLDMCHNHLYKLCGQDLYIHTSNNHWLKCGNRAKGKSVFKNRNYVLWHLRSGHYKIIDCAYDEPGIKPIKSIYTMGRFKKSSHNP